MTTLNKGYNDSLDADLQITTEEEIAYYLFNKGLLDEEDAGQAGRDILFLILEKFCPYFFEYKKGD